VHVECSGHTFSGMTVPHRTPSGLPHPARSAPLGAPQRAQQEGKLRCGLGRAALAAKVSAMRRRVEQHRAARARGQPPQPRSELGGAPGGHARVVRGGGDQRGRVGGAARGAQRVVRAERGQGGTVGGSPSSSRSCAVSGSPPSSIAVSTSTNGACPETQRKMTSMTLTLPYTPESASRARSCDRATTKPIARRPDACNSGRQRPRRAPAARPRRSASAAARARRPRPARPRWRRAARRTPGPPGRLPPASPRMPPGRSQTWPSRAARPPRARRGRTRRRRARAPTPGSTRAPARAGPQVLSPPTLPLALPQPYTCAHASVHPRACTRRPADAQPAHLILRAGAAHAATMQAFPQAADSGMGPLGWACGRPAAGAAAAAAAARARPPAHAFGVHPACSASQPLERVSC